MDMQGTPASHHGRRHTTMAGDAQATEADARGGGTVLAELAGGTLSSATFGLDALSLTEARVAELVAEGLTNPQVAKELLVGAETVKTHLSKVFAKLGVANRKELIVAASRRAAELHR